MIKILGIILNIVKSAYFWAALFVLTAVTAATVTSKQHTTIKAQKSQIKAQTEQIKQMNNTPAEVECKVELNFKSNKNGIVIIDADQQATKIAEEIKKKLK